MKLICLVLLALPALVADSFAAQPGPNVIIFLADDLGYGDVSCYGSKAVQTPNVDRLAKGGLRFTDAHATAATCTPSRYSLLTGEYAWRKKGTGVLPGDAALIIEPGRTTVASMMQKAGYTTGVVGKWHLGLGSGNIDWNSEIKPGPLEIGFDYSFIMAATGDRVPCVYLENHRVFRLDPADPIRVSYKEPFPGEPTGKANPELLKMHPSHGHDMAIVNGISRIGYMTGGKAALWKDEEMADRFTEKALAFIERNRGKPFFLYFATHDPHVPRVPHPRFVGKTSLGPRGDAIVQLDWCLGEVLNKLEQLKLADDTLVLFSSDNGPVVDDGYKDQAVEKLGDHRPAGPLRGGKYSAYEAGTRVPFIVRWPARVKPGVSEALVSHIDFLASFAKLTDQSLSTGEAPDSENILPALMGESQAGRTSYVEQGGPLALREGNWKYIRPSNGPKRYEATNTEPGNEPKGQVFDLSKDIGEKSNLVEKEKARFDEMGRKLDAIQRQGEGK
jgi:arylsulfatase A-like enzyme